VTVVAVVGLGYVGLPLAVEFGKVYPTIGFDLSESKVAAYRDGHDPTGEVSRAQFEAASRLQITTEAADLGTADFIVVAVRPWTTRTARTSDRCSRRAKRSAGT
jgi:UDP-N-acetyl-D-galactosamine dehydrogenase